MPKIFVSYRREDSAASAGRLGDRLVREFGENHVFMDVDSIPLGADFVKRLSDEVQRCDALLAVIGPQWSVIRDEDGNRRLDDPNDFVRVEIRAALQRDIPVVPVLLDGTKIPKAASLPDDIKPLVLRSGLDLGHVSFQKDLDRLVRQLRRLGTPFDLVFGKMTVPKAALLFLGPLLLIGLIAVLVEQYRLGAKRLQIPTSSIPTTSLTPITCAEERNLRSSATRVSTKINFLNSRAETVRTYWLDQSGTRVRYSELKPGQRTEQFTFVTHPWLVADERDNCIAIYLPSADPAAAIVR